MKFNYERLKDRIYACWLGKNIGGTMGGPYENRREILDIQGFSTEAGTVLPNDDLDLQLVWLRACENRGVGAVDAHVLGEYWYDFISPNWNEYGIGKANMRQGLMPPLSGEYKNEWKHSNGAWIRTEIWACMAPGCPDVAIKYAAEDACVDHGMGEGTYAAIFVAAMEAAAFIVQDVRELIRIGLSKIPEDCRMAQAARLICDCYDKGMDWKDARNALVEDSADLGWFQAPANVSFVLLGLLYGEGDFKKSMILAINCGDDTDCTAATIGSIMGIMGGTEFVPKDWCEHLGDEIVTVSVNKGCLPRVPKTCTELTERVMAQIPSMLFANGVTDVDIFAEQECADAENIAKFKGGAVAEDLCARPGRSFDMDFHYFRARVIFDDDPFVRPNGTVRMRVQFKHMIYGIGPLYLQLNWILPEGWSVPDCAHEAYVTYSRPSSSRLTVGMTEIAFTVHAGEAVQFKNRLILTVDCDGHPVPGLIPITILG